jgi:MHS family proline/betaine transporter-like MFS transporter
MSLGGEFSGSITYVVEHSPAKHRGLTGSACVVSLILGFLLGSFVSLLFVNNMSPEDFRSWGWRVPFLLGIIIGLVGLYIRSQCDESPAYEEARAQGHISDKPVRTAIMQHPKKMLMAFALYISVTMPFYLVSVYLLSFSKTKLGLAVGDALFINTATMLTMLVSVLVSAYASDRIGRKPVLLVSVLVMMASVLPLFMWMASAVYFNVLVAQMLLGLIVGCYVSCMPTVLVEIFPTSIRYTGMAMAYNLAAAIFGGTAPMVCEWLIGTTGRNDSIAYYVILCNLVSLVALYFYKDRYREPLLG